MEIEQDREVGMIMQIIINITQLTFRDENFLLCVGCGLLFCAL